MKEGFRRNMMKRNGRILIYLLLIAVAPACKSEKSVKKVPLEYFFKNPEKTQFAISPGGEYVSYLQPHNDRLNIYRSEERRVGKEVVSKCRSWWTPLT